MNFRNANMAEAAVAAEASFAANVRPVDAVLKNGTAATVLARGDLVMLDVATVNATGDYTQVILITTAGNLAATGSFHCVAQEAIAVGASGRFRFFGDTVLNLTVNAGVGAKIGPGTNNLLTGTTTMTTLTKVIGWTKVTGTGVKQVFFDGFPPGIAIAP